MTSLRPAAAIFCGKVLRRMRAGRNARREKGPDGDAGRVLQRVFCRASIGGCVLQRVRCRASTAGAMPRKNGPHSGFAEPPMCGRPHRAGTGAGVAGSCSGRPQPFAGCSRDVCGMSAGRARTVCGSSAAVRRPVSGRVCGRNSMPAPASFRIRCRRPRH